MAAVGNPDPLEFSDVRATEAKLKPLVEASGGGLMWLSDNPDPELRSVRPGRAAGGSDWIGLRPTKVTRWPASTSCRYCGQVRTSSRCDRRRPLSRLGKPATVRAGCGGHHDHRQGYRMDRALTRPGLARPEHAQCQRGAGTLPHQADLLQARHT